MSVLLAVVLVLLILALAGGGFALHGALHFLLWVIALCVIIYLIAALLGPRRRGGPPV